MSEATTIPDALYLLVSRPTNYGTSEEAKHYRIFSSWEEAEVIGWFETKDEAECAMSYLQEAYNHEAFGPPKQALAIARVELI